MSDAAPVFGAPPAGVACVPRAAAYAVLRDARGRIAAVREKSGWFLPGGGREAGESAEQNVLREIREECGRSARIVRPLGEAVQYFSDGRHWYEMRAVFFEAEFLPATSEGDGTHAWISSDAWDSLYHECHRWALWRARERAEPASDSAEAGL